MALNSPLALSSTLSLSIIAGIPAPTPKSLRLIEPPALKPANFLPSRPTVVPRRVRSKVTGLVTPLMVKSPVKANFLSAVLVIPVLLNVKLGNFVASNMSSFFKCPSRISLPVAMLATSAVKLKTASEKSSLELVTVASNFPKVPSTSEIDMWVTVKLNLECALSAVQVCACVAIVAKTAKQRMNNFFIKNKTV